jgi:hypothetical protein
VSELRVPAQTDGSGSLTVAKKCINRLLDVKKASSRYVIHTTCYHQHNNKMASDDSESVPAKGSVLATFSDHEFMKQVPGDEDPWLTAGVPSAHNVAAALLAAVPEDELLVAVNTDDGVTEDDHVWMYPLSFLRNRWGVTPDHIRACVRDAFKGAGNNEQECEQHANRVVPPGCTLLTALIHCSSMDGFNLGDLGSFLDGSVDVPSGFTPIIAVPRRFARLIPSSQRSSLG